MSPEHGGVLLQRGMSVQLEHTNSYVWLMSFVHCQCMSNCGNDYYNYRFDHHFHDIVLSLMLNIKSEALNRLNET